MDWNKSLLSGGFALAAGDQYLKLFRDALLTSSDYSILQHKLGEIPTLGDAEEEAGLRGAAIYAHEMLI